MMKISEKNVGTGDRALRVVLALVLFAAYGIGYVKGIIGYFVLLVALILLLTGIFSTCGLSSVLGISTAKKGA